MYNMSVIEHISYNKLLLFSTEVATSEIMFHPTELIHSNLIQQGLRISSKLHFHI